MVKYEEMMELLNSLGDEIFADWCEMIPEVCNTSLAKTLLLVDAETRMLTLNFDKEVRGMLMLQEYISIYLEKSDVLGLCVQTER